MHKIDRLGWAAGMASNAYGHRIGIRVSDAGALPRAMACLPPGCKVTPRSIVDCLYSIVVGSSPAKASDTSGKRRAAAQVKRFHILYRGSERIVRTHDVDELYRTLESDLQLHVAGAAVKRVFLHAGVVGWRGRAIVLPGRSFAGKSTLVEALLRAGAVYYSDEYAILDERGRVHPFPRALKLRTPTGEVAAERLPEGRVGKRALPVGLVALVHYQPGATWQVEALSPGQGLLALMESAVPVRNRPQLTLTTLREIVRQTSVVKGVRGEVGEAVERLLQMMRESVGTGANP